MTRLKSRQIRAIALNLARATVVRFASEPTSWFNIWDVDTLAEHAVAKYPMYTNLAKAHLARRINQ